ncbi:glucan 1,3-beta-glucosidase [Irpex rosettiformis]|uniref:Glucan 1,3-beta-glucosidase n=1 Tax=Irpex rosettiformis TaxID=378272 RepID=A0ACB8UG47_9APHY|nr:glucan 1,3-beta-glucosidase [Irpex rosettiformis]
MMQPYSSKAFLTFLAFISALLVSVHALGSSCSTPLTKGNAGPNDPFWLQNIKHQGSAAFNSNPSGYQVFRNVKDFGAKGDGTTDDTAAINNAISSGNRCGNGCASTTTQPAVIYLPPGTYKISSPLVLFYQSQMIGDARTPPTLLAAPNFNGRAIIDADPTLAGGAEQWTNQNNFFRSVRNIIFDLRQQPSATGLHWQVSQATSLMNLVFQMTGNNRGIEMENGSGGFLGDIVFNGGATGASFGNQQFTFRNLTFNNVGTGISAIWGWSLTYQGLTINSAQIGIDITIGDAVLGNQGVGSYSIIDAVVSNTPTFIRLSKTIAGQLDGSLVLNNVKLTNVPNVVAVNGGATILNGGTTTIDSWAQGNVYHGTNGNPNYIQANIPSIPKDSSLLDSSGRVFGRSHPQYADYAVSDFASVKDHGAKGDGNTDDTAAIKAFIAQFAGCKILYFPAGTYIVTDTIQFPAGSQIVGEVWTQIMGAGNTFIDYNNPRPVVQVGAPGSTGLLEITDIIFTTRAPAAGAIIVEWNIGAAAGQKGAAGAWDTHLIIGGTAGSNMQVSQCPTSGSGGNNCFADYLGIHLTSGSTAYLEGTWVWLSDHDLDSGGQTQVSLWSGHGILSESQGPVWLIGTASEHHIVYQYYLKNARNHYIGVAQTESPYFQPNPTTPAPFINNNNFDPAQLSSGSAWALTVENSQNIVIFGAGFYSFFQAYSTACQNTKTCQQQVVNIDNGSGISIYNLNTVDLVNSLSISNQPIIQASKNQNGLSSTVTVWTRN